MQYCALKNHITPSESLSSILNTDVLKNWVAEAQMAKWEEVKNMITASRFDHFFLGFCFTESTQTEYTQMSCLLIELHNSSKFTKNTITMFFPVPLYLLSLLSKLFYCPKGAVLLYILLDFLWCVFFFSSFI